MWTGVTPLQLEYRLQSPGCCSCAVETTEVATRSPTTFCGRLLSPSLSDRSKKRKLMKIKSASYKTSNTAVKSRAVVIVAEGQIEKSMSRKPKLTGSFSCVKLHRDMSVVKTDNERGKRTRYNKKSNPEREVNTNSTDTSIRSAKQPKLVISRSYHPQIEKVTNQEIMAASNSGVSCFDSFSKAPSRAINRRQFLPKVSLSKCESSWQKHLVSKVKLTKTAKCGRVLINSMNISKVNAVRCLLLSKFGAWRDRSPLIGLLRKHGKWRHRSGLWSPLTGHVSSVASDATNLTSAATEMIVTCETGNMEKAGKRKDKVSSSCSCDVQLVSSDNVVTSSTSSQPLADNDYDNDDDERVTSADTQTPDDVLCASTTKEVRLLNCAIAGKSDELLPSKSDEKDKTTLCVPIRLGEHGELLLRLPQNVSVECSFRPVAAPPVTPVVPTTSGSSATEPLLPICKPCEPLGCTSQLKNLRQAETIQHGDTHLQSNLDYLKTTVSEPASVTSLSEIGISGDSGMSLASSPFATESNDCCATISSDNNSRLTSEQLDISMFPFVTVSPPRRKMAPTNSAILPPAASRTGLTSPLPVVCSSAVGKPRSARSDVNRPSQSVIRPETTNLKCINLLQRNLEIDKVADVRRAVIKVPVYTASFRDSKNERRHVKNQTCSVSSAGVLDLTVSPTVKHETSLHDRTRKTVEQTVDSEVEQLMDDKTKLLPVFQKTSAPDFVEKCPSRKQSEDASESIVKSASSLQHSGGSVSGSVPRLCVSLERCDAVGRQYPSVNTVAPPAARRLKLMCNGITIYRTLEDGLCSEQIHKRRRSSSRCKSLELLSCKPRATASNAKNRHGSTADEDLAPAYDKAAERQIVCSSTREISEDCTERPSVDHMVMDEPLELTTQRARERFRELEGDLCATALDLSVNAIV